MISAPNVLGLVDEQLFELRIAQHLRVVLERICDALLLGRGEHGAVVRHVGKDDREGREHDRPREGEPKRQSERASGGVHTRGLADSLL
jgi:hypothetical protein